MNETVNVNKEYKDSVFSLLFSDPDVLRELYSAIEGIDLPPRGAHANLKACYYFVFCGIFPRRDYANTIRQRPSMGRFFGPPSA